MCLLWWWAFLVTQGRPAWALDRQRLIRKQAAAPPHGLPMQAEATAPLSSELLVARPLWAPGGEEQLVRRQRTAPQLLPPSPSVTGPAKVTTNGGASAAIGAYPSSSSIPPGSQRGWQTARRPEEGVDTGGRGQGTRRRRPAATSLVAIAIGASAQPVEILLPHDPAPRDPAPPASAPPAFNAAAAPPERRQFPRSGQARTSKFHSRQPAGASDTDTKEPSTSAERRSLTRPSPAATDVGSPSSSGTIDAKAPRLSDRAAERSSTLMADLSGVPSAGSVGAQAARSRSVVHDASASDASSGETRPTSKTAAPTGRAVRVSHVSADGSVDMEDDDEDNQARALGSSKDRSRQQPATAALQPQIVSVVAQPPGVAAAGAPTGSQGAVQGAVVVQAPTVAAVTAPAASAQNPAMTAVATPQTSLAPAVVSAAAGGPRASLSGTAAASAALETSSPAPLAALTSSSDSGGRKSELGLHLLIFLGLATLAATLCAALASLGCLRGGVEQVVGGVTTGPSVSRMSSYRRSASIGSLGTPRSGSSPQGLLTTPGSSPKLAVPGGRRDRDSSGGSRMASPRTSPRVRGERALTEELR